MSQILDDLPDAQVFSRDPETFSEHDIKVLIDRLKRHVARMRKARQDDAAVQEIATKTKKLNAAARKKKSKLATDPMDTIIT